MENFWFFWRKYGSVISALIILAATAGWFAEMGYFWMANRFIALVVAFAVGELLVVCVFAILSCLYVAARRDDACPYCCNAGGQILRVAEKKNTAQGSCSTSHSFDDPYTECDCRHTFLIIETTTTYHCPCCGKDFDHFAQSRSMVR